MKNLNLFLMWLVIATVMFSCKNDQENTDILSDGSLTLTQAKEWFESNYPEFIVIKQAGEELPIVMKPIWEGGFHSEDADYETIETLVATKDHVFYATKECREEYEATGNSNYQNSLTRFVVLKHKSSGNMECFLMNIIGEKEYLEHKNFELWSNTYLQKDRNFSGIVFLKALDGSHIEGWRYTDGVITHTITPADEELDSDESPSIRTLGVSLNCTYIRIGTTIYCSRSMSGTESCYNNGGICYGHPSSSGYWSCQVGSSPNPPGSNPPPIAPSENLGKIANKIYLDNTGLSNLNQALDQYIANFPSPTANPYAYLVMRNVRVDFKIGGSSVSYDHSTKTLYFASNNHITRQNLEIGINQIVSAI